MGARARLARAPEGRRARLLHPVALGRRACHRTNVTDRSLVDLLSRPPAFDQDAPAGYLAIEKLAVTLFRAERARRARSIRDGNRGALPDGVRRP